MPSFPPGACHKGGQIAAPVLREQARAFYEPLVPLVLELHGRGLSLRAIAAELERRSIKTRQEWPHWSATQVRRILARALDSAAGPIDAPAPGAAGPRMDRTVVDATQAAPLNTAAAATS